VCGLGGTHRMVNGGECETNTLLGIENGRSGQLLL
jgi:hypothetical protein